MYPSTKESYSVSSDEDWDDETYARAQEHAEAFFEEIWLELANYGELEDLLVADNVAEHMVGNVYCKYLREDDAVEAVNKLQKRFYGARLIQPEFSPVTDFRESRCKAFYETRCSRGGMCNFIHAKHIPRAVKRKVVREMYAEHPDFNGRGNFQRERSRSKGKEDTDAKEEKPAKKERKQRQSTEERRAMIAEWNKEAAREAGAAPGAGAVVAPPPAPLVAGIQVVPPPNLLGTPHILSAPAPGVTASTL